MAFFLVVVRVIIIFIFFWQDDSLELIVASADFCFLLRLCRPEQGGSGRTVGRAQSLP